MAEEELTKFHSLYRCHIFLKQSTWLHLGVPDVCERVVLESRFSQVAAASLTPCTVCVYLYIVITVSNRMSDMIVPANFHCNTKVKSSASPGFRVNRDYFGNHQSASTAVWFADTFVHPSCKATRHGPFHSALFRFKFLQLGNHENCILHLGSIFSTHAIGCIGH